MSVATLESQWHTQSKEADFSGIEEEVCRCRIFTLREGLRNVFKSHGVVLSAGTSNATLVVAIAQLCNKPSPGYSEHLETSWKKEYGSVAEAIGIVAGAGPFTAETDPQEILQAIQR